MRGSRSASGFQSLSRRGVLSVSYTIVSLRLVSIFSVRLREDGRMTPTSRNSTATIAREIRISIKRVIQGSPGRTAAYRGRSPQSYQTGHDPREPKFRPDSPRGGPGSHQLQLERLQD